MHRVIRYLISAAAAILLPGCRTAGESSTGVRETSPRTLRVLQLNSWYEGGNVPGGRQMIAHRIRDYAPDIVLLSEIQNAPAFGRDFREFMKEKGGPAYEYTAFPKGMMILSRFPIVRSRRIYGGAYAELKGPGRRILVCSMHLNSQDYACYLPRGYNGSTWKKLPEKVSDVREVMDMNIRSGRCRTMENMLKEAEDYIRRNDLVILGGDFNEPSHLDWTRRTRNMYDHNGMVMPWHTTALLEKTGFADCYRLIHPDEVKYPGHTVPVNNPLAPVRKLSSAPEADERDRIDYIFYNRKADGVRLQKAGLIGPDTLIVRGQRDSVPQKGTWIRIRDGWPSDHAGNFAEFLLLP